MDALFSNFGVAIAAALVAGFISLLGLVISKEQKISEFRQAWIDALRDDVAVAISHANAVYNQSATVAKSLDRKLSWHERWQEAREDIIALSTATARIQLRLNPMEPPSIEILNSIRALEALISENEMHLRFKEYENIEKTLVEQTNLVLKQEWLRVRRGEKAFCFTLRIIIAVTVLVSVTLIYYLLRYWVSEYKI